jgi:hypothetical protein
VCLTKYLEAPNVLPYFSKYFRFHTYFVTVLFVVAKSTVKIEIFFMMSKFFSVVFGAKNEKNVSAQDGKAERLL